ncbi:hypothetical protein [Streptomyces inhibens]|uniref:hypothetical protein n=1 Tax=Streptomyces inhibens TaxID=2293571 RepID=UPI003CC82AE0
MATALRPGLLPGIDAYTVKVNAKFPGAGPALRGVICLHSGRDGELLALEAALLTVDDRRLAATTGALANAGLPADVVDATLGEILRQRHPGRTHPDQVTVYAPVGLPWQDLALTWTAHREAERRGLGTVIDLLG